MPRGVHKLPTGKRKRQILARYRFGLTEAEFENLLAITNCEVCGRELAEYGADASDLPRPHIDHCHDSQGVRGVLCGRCNTALGLMAHNTLTLQTAVSYLKRPVRFQKKSLIPRPTHCKHGHEFTPENTYTPPSAPNKRMCRTCRTHRQKESRNADRSHR